MKLTRLYLAAAILAVAAAAAQASVTLQMNAGELYKFDGTTPLPIGSTLVLVADVNGNGFGDLTQATTSWTAQADDKVVFRIAAPDVGAGDGFFTAVQNINYAALGVAANQKLELVWYDKAYTAAAAGPGAGTHFGIFRTDVVDAANNSDIAWALPADGQTVNLNFMTGNMGGASGESAGIASLTTVTPEPATMVLLAVGGVAALIRRRSHKA